MNTWGVGNGLSLVEDFRKSVSIVEVLFMRYGCHDDAVSLGHRHRGFGSKLLLRSYAEWLRQRGLALSRVAAGTTAIAR